jgi:hypothetical protein
VLARWANLTKRDQHDEEDQSLNTKDGCQDLIFSDFPRNARRVSVQTAHKKINICAIANTEICPFHSRILDSLKPFRGFQAGLSR